MKRNIITYILSYIAAIVISVLYIYIWLIFFNLEDHGVKLGICLGTCFCLAMVVFYFAGKRFLKPTGKKKIDLTVFLPGTVLFIFYSIYYVISYWEDVDSLNGHKLILFILPILAGASLLPSLLLWLGMLRNKEKEPSNE